MITDPVTDPVTYGVSIPCRTDTWNEMVMIMMAWKQAARVVVLVSRLVWWSCGLTKDGGPFADRALHAQSMVWSRSHALSKEKSTDNEIQWVSRLVITGPSCREFGLEPHSLPTFVHREPSLQQERHRQLNLWSPIVGLHCNLRAGAKASPA